MDWWNRPPTLVGIFFALCLLLLTWSIAGIACRACHLSGTFFHCDTHTRAHARMHTHLFYCNLERLRFLKKCTWLLWNFYSLIHLVHCPVLFFSLQYYCWHHYTEFALFVHKQRLDQLCGVWRQVLPVHCQCGWRLNWSADKTMSFDWFQQVILLNPSFSFFTRSQSFPVMYANDFCSPLSPTPICSFTLCTNSMQLDGTGLFFLWQSNPCF